LQEYFILCPHPQPFPICMGKGALDIYIYACPAQAGKAVSAIAETERGHYALIMLKNCGSSTIVILSALALSALEPGLSPSRT